MTGRRALGLVAQVGLVAVVGWFAFDALRDEWVRFGGIGVPLDPRPLWIVAAAGLVGAAFLMLVTAWRAIVVGWGEALSWRSGASIWFISNLGRFVPGKLWTVAGMAVMARRAGVSGAAAIGSAVLMQVLAISSGGALALGLVPREQLTQLLPGWVLWTGAAAVPAAALWLAMSESALGRLTSLLGRPELALRPLTKWGAVLGMLATLVGWGCYGLSLVFLARGLVPDVGIATAFAIGAFAGAYIVGLLAVFVPGGIGVREGVLVALLAPTTGPGAALVLAVGSRLVMTVMEIGSAGVALLAGGRLPTTTRPDGAA